MPRFFNLVRRRGNKQPVVMSYVDEVKDEEVLRVVKHNRNRSDSPTLPRNGGAESSGTMTTEESDDRSVVKQPTIPPQPTQPLALVAEVGSEVPQLIKKNGPSTMRAAATVDPKMIATPNQNLKKASSTRSWVKKASTARATIKKIESFLPGKVNGERQKEKTAVPKIDTTHDGSISHMDSPTRYLPESPQTPVTVGAFLCTPSLECIDHSWFNSEADDRTIHPARTESSFLSWASRFGKTENQLGIPFIDNVLDQIVGDDDTYDGLTVMDESTIGPSLIFSPESSKKKFAATPTGTPQCSSRREGAQRLMGQLAKWDEMDKLDDESCTQFDGKDATDRTLALEFSQSAGSDYTSDFATDDEETALTGGSAYTSEYTNI